MLTVAKRPWSEEERSVARSGERRTFRGGRLPPLVAPLAVALLVSALIGSNTFLAIGAVALLLIGSVLLWRPGETPVLLFVFAYQWLQICTGVFYASWLGLNIQQFSQFAWGDMQTAVDLSMIGLLVFACGMRWGAGAARPIDAEILRRTARRRRTREWFWLYVATWFIAAVLQILARLVPGLSQPFLAAAELKWAFYWILTYAAFSTWDGVGTYWLVAFMLALLSSLGGYFSDFKTVFFFTIFGLIAVRVRLAARTYVILVVLGTLLLTMGVVWTSIKPEYRKFVSGGRDAQIVTVSFDARINKLADLVSNVDAASMSRGLDDLIRRVAYLDYFSLVIDYVPREIPYQEGAIWWDAITRPFTPRLLFPGKTDINDSQRTNEFTGLHVAGADSGTSISIGYMAETYIDFGPIGMMAVLIAFGYFLGRIYKRFVTFHGFLGMALATAIIQQAEFYEKSITKMFGGIIVSLLVSWLLIRIVIPKWAPWLRA